MTDATDTDTDDAPPEHEHPDERPTDVDALIDLLAGRDMWHTPAVGAIPEIRMSDGPAGVRGTDWSGPASASFPCGTALAATFDPDLVREVGRALAREARSKNAHVLLGPTVNLHRTPIGGRNFECFSEDPVHTAAIATAYVDGVQSGGVACCIKHLVGNDTEYARFVVSSEIPERVLRELYLVPFEAAVAGGVRSIMTAYNRLGGTYCSEHRWLLTDLVRGEWGFDGLLVSDWYGTHSTLDALLAGLDVEMPGPPLHRGDLLRAALADPDLDPDTLAAARVAITRSAERVAALAEWTGAASTDTTEGTAEDPETRAVARRAAAAGTVLLTNDTGLLPLSHGTRLALIGPHAATGRLQGGGSAKVRADRPSGLLSALRDRGFAVDHAPGCRIDKYLPLLRGTYRITLRDDHGTEVVDTRDRVQVTRQHHEPDGLDGPISGHVDGTFTVDTAGNWRIGVRAVGAATLRIDGAETVTIDGTQRGGSFYGFGSDEIVAEVHLDAGEHHLELDYPRLDSGGMFGFMVGAAPAAEPDLFSEAVAVAAAADVAIVVVGTDDDWETEGEDRTRLELPGRQDELVAAVAAANPNTVVLVNAGSPVTMPWLDQVAAVAQIWFPGGQLGAAVTDVLIGDVEPGGRLPITFPRSLADTPAVSYHPGDGVHAEYGEGLRIGHRWYDDRSIEPLFWFGHGLGYTTIEIGPTAVDGNPGTGAVHVHTELHHTGHRPGAEVVQVYTRYLGDDSRVEPLLRFVGSHKAHLVPGERRTVTIVLPDRSFASWLDGAWHVPAGDHEVLVGRSAGTTERVAVLTVD